eukprot:3609804-Rhodomonas_salina.3
MSWLYVIFGAPPVPHRATGSAPHLVSRAGVLTTIATTSSRITLLPPETQPENPSLAHNLLDTRTRSRFKGAVGCQPRDDLFPAERGFAAGQRVRARQ